MRVLFTSATFASHLYPLVPLAWAFRAAGHEVRVAVQPPLLGEVTAAGLPAVEAGGDLDFIVELKQAVGSALAESGGAPPTLEQIMVPHVRAAAAVAADLVPFARRWAPDLVVADPAAFVAPVVARAAGAPLALNTWGPMPADLWSHLTSERAVRENWPKTLVAFLDEWDAPLGPDYAAYCVDPCPDELLAVRMPNRYPARFVPYGRAAVAPSWLAEPAGRPRVCITWGTTNGAFLGADALAAPLTIIDALTALDVEVVAALGKAGAELLGDRRERVRAVDWMPLSTLLPTCDALVSQGGPGTVLAAVAHGVPQLVVPSISAQPLGAELLAASGAGLSLTPGELTAESVTAAMSELLTGASVRDAARTLGERNAARPSPAEIARTLEALVRG
ncbi:nucleotide disphospho-sugar-binding domain-containing protein [Actinomadura kijaniata]|uniref:Glycosyltransferase n=1 Tax=Actinomadura kijaniata TaxID=46161 RepID=B3TMR7_ACTKI|nr:nucleotide disphospho-sugar-binding domain-containing protein [Actinomadura kijaniata]ACB46497.1 glycosyltransferase [Actinomadura kijaniata]